MARSAVVATYSIAACDLQAGQWGVAVQSKFLAVGSVVPWAEPQVGAVATQAWANPRYGPDGLALLRSGKTAEEVVGALTTADEGREHRQLGVVDAAGRAASYTGGECNDWAGSRSGDGYAAQGNILVSGETVDALAVTFESNAHLELAERLIECLASWLSEDTKSPNARERKSVETKTNASLANSAPVTPPIISGKARIGKSRWSAPPQRSGAAGDAGACRAPHLNEQERGRVVIAVIARRGHAAH